jgi:hypothetical protein
MNVVPFLQLSVSYTIFNGTVHFKNVKKCWNTNITLVVKVLI